MDKNSWVQLIIAIVLIGIFMTSWLIFKNIKISDWMCLAVGILDLVIFALYLNKKKK